ncbi:uncharacterized protein LAJ45_11236 [Morchella importuna]|uniref:uncharacterized protein n=1 Tax=Morchella importuna TaxID=1174673 RepID=UPI001E8DBC67|nr:uncharacterized protein LAJ45_11236 [Morchella importuna]KAH8144735.1 hypothetical protein LAJ45_11236 [Morchella importuna]
MRPPSFYAPTTASALLLLLTTALTPTPTHALTATAITQPTLNLDGLGRVGIAGDFSGLSIVEYAGQSETSPFANGTQSLLSRLPNGVFTTLASSDAQIQALCVHELADGTVKGIFVGGNFTGLGNVAASGVALWSPEDGSVMALAGLAGKVHALLCDREKGTVYVGGDFKANESNSSNAISWVDGKGWTDLPFDGFNGPVKSITATANGTVVFGGSFTSLGNASSPLVRHAQTVNLVSTNITATQTTDLAGFNDPSSIVCSEGTSNQWLTRDGQLGSWTAGFKFEFKPTKLKLRNADHEGRGTKIFRFTAFPLAGIMNLTYTDSSTNETKFCDAWCELGEGATQEYFFVNDVNMNAIRIDIFEYYGAGGGLAGIELFQDDIFAFASTELNEPTCASSSADARSTSTATGPWTAIDNDAVDSEYLSVNLDATELSTARVVFEPHIQQSGDTRGQINVTGTYTADGTAESPVILFQTNDYDKYDTVYRGRVDASESGFRPSVTLTPASSQSFSTVNIVAQKVQFQLWNNMTSSGSGTTSTESTGTTDLNGLYEFDPTQTGTPTASDIASSVVNSAGRGLGPSATVIAMTAKDDITYVAGNFSADDGSFLYFFSIGPDGPITPSKGGLNGTVYSMLLADDILYVGGNFQNTNTESTDGVGFVVGYDTTNNEWVTLGAGVNGRVMDIVALSVNVSSGTQEAIAISGDFNRIEASGSSAALDVDGFAVWVPSQNQWLELMDGDRIAIQGVLSASVSIPNDSVLYAGSISSQSLEAFGAVTITDTDPNTLQPLPMIIQETSSSSLRRRTVVSADYQGVVTGAFYNEGSANLTILGGHFTAEATAGGTVSNLAVINGASNDSVTGFGTEINNSSVVMTLAKVDALLFVGGSIEGTVGSTDVKGVVVWDMSTNALASEQPVGLEGDAVAVYSINRRPNTQEIFVGGAFSSAGSLPCPSLCVFDNSAKQWTNIGGDVNGTVNIILWLDNDSLLVGGDMTLNNTATYLAVYSAKSSAWEAFTGDISNIPGPVQSIAFDSSAKDSFFISGVTVSDGSAYLMKYGNNNDNKFITVDGLGDGSTIRNVQVLELSTEHASTDSLSSSQSLLVMGSLDLPSFGNASAALYNGSNWTPFLLASKENGERGSVASLFSENEQNFNSGRKKLARGFVILISLAIALGLVFLIVVLGVLSSYLRRRREGYSPAPTRASPVEQSMQMQSRLSPAALFGSIGQNSAGSPGSRPMLT